MTVTAPVSLSKVKTEFGGPNNLAAYVRGGAYVPDTPANAAISTTAAGLKLSQFVNASAAPAFTPVTRTYNTVGSAVETAPAGCSNVIIAVWGGGGSGEGVGRYGLYGGDGGGSGGYAQSSYAITGGQTLNYTVGGGGLGVISGSNPGTASSASSGSKAITTMTANGGGVSATRTGGSATGGNQTNTSGNTGGTAALVDGSVGGAGGLGVLGYGSQRAGSGGNGGDGNDITPGVNSPGDGGNAGRVVFYYT